jgi:hypothetical protein
MSAKSDIYSLGVMAIELCDRAFLYAGSLGF